MSLLAAFIGIDRYADPKIRELAGARRDATALWALFADTLPGSAPELIVDSAATAEGIRQAFDRTLGAAGPDDTVVIAYSGHGTHDHRLVAHDTARDRLEATTIPMAELAERFKQSRAKAVLCLLDCCFSGGAPARVLEDSPVPRSPGTPLEGIGGNGRILIAASNVNEMAIEYPGGGHGLLTAAILEVFQSPEDTVQLTTAMDQVMQRVRAEALRMGHIQTPVLFGHVEGGLVLPGLRRGEKFYKAFPELKGVRVTGPIDELAACGLPDTILSEWKTHFSSNLNPLQLLAVNDHRILDGCSLLVVAPTSSGKTFIGEMAAARVIVNGRKAAFLFPYKALVNEKHDQFSKLYGERGGLRVVRCTGDYQDQVSAFVRGKYDLALLTYEMFLNVSVSSATVLNQLGLVVVDEAQFISDPRRGIVVELLLTHLRAARERGINPQIVALSAVIGALNHLDEWLGCGKLVTTERPVPLAEGVLDRSGVLHSLEADGTQQTTQFLPRNAIVQRRDKPGAQDVLVPLVGQLLSQNENERVIIFRNNRGSAQGSAKYLADDLGLPAAQDIITELPTHDLSTSSTTLRECFAGGTAFHNTNLTREEREVVERAFRQRTGLVRVLTATTTVAAGINTPASTVILAENEFKGEDGRPFTVAEYKNMAGRAGRLGYNETGRAIILADTATEREFLFSKYVLGKPEAMRSSFDPAHLETWVLRLLAQVPKVPIGNVVSLLANTYGGYLANRERPGWGDQMADRLVEIVGRMMDLDLLEEEEGYVHLTLLGRAVGRSSLAFQSAMRLIGILKARRNETLSEEHLMVILQGLPELDALTTPLFKRGQSEACWPRHVAQRFGHGIATWLQRQAEDNWTYYERCKRAMVLSAWISGSPMEAIERDHHTTNSWQGRIGHGDVKGFADATRFHLRPAYQIVTVLLMSGGPTEEAIEELLVRLEVGIPSDCVDLLNLPVSMTRGQYLALRALGLMTQEAVWNASKNLLVQVLGAVGAARLEAYDERQL